MNTARQRINTLKDIIREPHTWPGMYEKAALMGDCGIVCHKCLNEEYRNTLHSTKYGYKDGWEVIGVVIDCELPTGTACNHCGNIISYY